MVSSLLGLTPWLVPIGIAGLATATTDGFYLHLVIMWGIYSILTLGLNVVIGFAGLLALGQAGRDASICLRPLIRGTRGISQNLHLWRCQLTPQVT